MTLVPAIRDGVAVPVPPLATDTGVERAIVPLVIIVPPVNPFPAVMLVTPLDPLEDDKRTHAPVVCPVGTIVVALLSTYPVPTLQKNVPDPPSPGLPIP